jgi:hypothetical protein
MRLESSSDTAGSVANRPSVAENWQPNVDDLASMKLPAANAGQAVAPIISSASVLACMVLPFYRESAGSFAVPSGCTTESRRWKWGLDFPQSSSMMIAHNLRQPAWFEQHCTN